MENQDRTKFQALLNYSIDLIKRNEGKPKKNIVNEIANELGKSPATVYSWIKTTQGTPPLPDGITIKKLAKYLWKRGGFSSEEQLKEFLQATGLENTNDLISQIVNSDNYENNPASPETPKLTGFKLLLYKIKVIQFSKIPLEFFIVFIFLVLFIAAPLFLFTGSVENIRLATWHNNSVFLEVNGISVNNSNVKTGENITAIFKILNKGTRIVVIRSLVMGTNGPNINCKDSLDKRWGKEGSYPFKPIMYIIILPGKEYEYKISRTFTEKGSYFAEPVIQDIYGNWGGITPFTCVNFTIIE